MARHTHCKRGVRDLAGGRTARGELLSCLPPDVQRLRAGSSSRAPCNLTLAVPRVSTKRSSWDFGSYDTAFEIAADASPLRPLTRQTVLDLLDKHAVTLQECDEVELARHVNELVTALRDKGKR